MKRHRSIETDRIPITDAEISSYKPPFDTLLNQKYPAHSSGRNPRLRSLWGVLAGIAAVATMLVVYFVIFADRPDDRPVEEGSPQVAALETSRKVDPPEPGLLAYETFTIKKGKQARFSTQKGSTIAVPPEAFTFLDGTPCNEDVELTFIEFQNVLEIFLSGIPMQYDSAGTEYTFESAGMFDIRASSQGQPLKLAEGKGIDIGLVSNQMNPYNIYYYDTIRNSWGYRGTEKEEQLVKRNSTALTLAEPFVPGKEQLQGSGSASSGTQTIADLAPGKLLRKRDKRFYAFKIDFDGMRFPELANMKDLLFEVSDTTVEKQYLRGTWDSIALSGNHGDGYKVTLFRLRKKMSFDARPVMNPAAYEEAIASYQQAVDERARSIAERESSVQNQRKTSEAMRENMQQWALSRNLRVYDLGIWNCDRPIPTPESPMAFRGYFQDPTGNALVPEHLYVTQKNRNLLWTYRAGQTSKYSYISENLMWFLLPDGRYAIISDNQLRSKEKVITPAIVSSSDAMKLIGAFI
jgi:hypothetical protein